jgi:hypothetical protein
MTIRDKVAAYREAMAEAGAQEIRLALPTPAAVALAKELDPAQARHPEQLAAAIAQHDALQAAPSADDVEALAAYGAAYGAVATAFWDAFEGQTIDGVEIIRRRA